MSSSLNILLQTLIGLFFSINSFSQRNIDVANLNIKLSFDETQDYYYSFDTGDEIVFNFQMKKGRHFKYVEISSPTNVISTEFKAKRIANQRIKVLNKGIYRFRFYSSSLTNRVANVNIQRVPSSNGKNNFNTGWKWKRIIDTTHIPYVKDSLIGYKITPYEETVKELIDKKRQEILLFQKSQRVHSYYNENKSKTYLRVNLPHLENTLLKKEKIIAWGYWIGVGKEGQMAYEENVRNFSSFIGETADQYFQTPLAGIAVGVITELILPKLGDDVEYYFIPDHENAKLFYNDLSFLQFDMGKGKGAYGRNDRKTFGTFYIGLSNDNKIRGIDVEVKVIAIKEVQLYEFKTYKRQKKEPQYIKLNKTRMQINERKYRVPVE
jgi:hypothetical protein